MILFLYLLYDFLIYGSHSNRVPGTDSAEMETPHGELSRDLYFCKRWPCSHHFDMRVKMIKYIIFLSSTKSFWKWQCSCCDSPSVHDDGIMVLCINALSPQSYTKYGQQYMTLNSLPSEVLYNIRAILERFFYDLLIYSIDSNLLASIGKYCPIKLLLKVRDWHWK